ncbi:hypothetical protein [Leptospira interrogans]|uniref:hypothetical protein n=1 Tax=Leptospira interrogans TaxID=173 RepID=UPI000344AAF6|nr:hypothetical protein [Leptospira interrogans]QCO35629.1 hypothetical protein E4414_21715 [Leptospira interrogans]UMQ52631.1 hypothetical protein FH582_02050 [Leptospira interrogans]
MSLDSSLNLERIQALCIFISSKAKRRSLKSGQNVLFRRGNNLICRKPNGEEIVVKELPPRLSNFPTEYDLS